MYFVTLLETIKAKKISDRVCVCVVRWGPEAVPRRIRRNFDVRHVQSCTLIKPDNGPSAQLAGQDLRARLTQSSTLPAMTLCRRKPTDCSPLSHTNVFPWDNSGGGSTSKTGAIGTSCKQPTETYFACTHYILYSSYNSLGSHSGASRLKCSVLLKKMCRAIFGDFLTISYYSFTTDIKHCNSLKAKLLFFF